MPRNDFSIDLWYQYGFYRQPRPLTNPILAFQYQPPAG
jgi:hypothetical protein